MDIVKITLREYCEGERKRLISVPMGPYFEKWLNGREWPLPWMKAQFGPTLTEKDGVFHASGVRVDDCDCSVCQRESGLDQEVIQMEFSFCDEYSCGMIICLACLEEFVCKLRPRLKCAWKDTGGYWESSCGLRFAINDGTPADNGMTYCPRCGKGIE